MPEVTPTSRAIETLSAIGMRGQRQDDEAGTPAGRKRMAPMDAQGRAPALAVMQDHDVLPALDTGKAAWPRLRLAIANVL